MSADTPPRRRDAERTREAILAAAEKLFASRGYERTSLQLIGEAAGFSRGTASYFFGSKDELYRAVLERVHLEYQRSSAEVFSRLDEGADLEDLLHELVEMYFNQPQRFVWLVERELLRGSQTLSDVTARQSALEDDLAHIERLVQRHLQPVDARQLYVTIVALGWFPTIGASSMFAALGVDWSDPAYRESYRNFVVRMLLDGLRARRDDVGDG